MTGDRVPVAIAGASGLVGQQLVRLLADHPLFELRELLVSDRSAGLRLSERWSLDEAEPPSDLGARRLRELQPGRLARSGTRLVFSALPSGVAAPVETALVSRGVPVFSNAADHRLDPRGLLVVPEVNAGHLALWRPRHPPIVCNPNCTTAGLVLPLAALSGLLGVRRVHVSSYQALSGAGLPGTPALLAAGNVIPFIPQEEEKLARETALLLGRPSGRVARPARLPVLAHCARVPVRHGHLEAVTLECRRTPSLSAIQSALEHFAPLRDLDLPTAPEPPIVLRSEPDRPQPRLDLWAGSPVRARGMAVSVGRLRWAPPFLRMYLLSHNLVRGAAGGALLNAELAYAQGRLGPRGQ